MVFETEAIAISIAVVLGFVIWYYTFQADKKRTDYQVNYKLPTIGGTGGTSYLTIIILVIVGYLIITQVK